jgi:hypothetical protein
MIPMLVRRKTIVGGVSCRNASLVAAKEAPQKATASKPARTANALARLGEWRNSVFKAQVRDDARSDRFHPIGTYSPHPHA